MTTRKEKQLIFARAFIVFTEIVMGNEGQMEAGEFAAHLSVTLGKFVHDFVPAAGRARCAKACTDAITKIATEEEPAESVH